MLVGGSDAVRCKLFMSMLTGMAMEWFISLPDGHITSFAQLSQLFREQYIANRAPPPVSYDLFDVVPHDNDHLVISVVTAGRRVHRVLVDQGSSADLMFWSTFNKLQLSPDLLMPYTGCLYGFAGDQVEVRGYLELRTMFTDGTTSRTESIRYLVVNANSAYNILLGRLALNRLRAVASTRHMKMKLPDLSGRVIVIKSDQEEARKCYENSLKTKRGVVMVMECPPVSDTPMEVEPLEEATPVEAVPRRKRLRGPHP